MVSVSINFTANPAINYVITYKKNVDTTWITPPGNPTNTAPFIINGLDENTLYDFRVQTNCGIVTVQKMTDEGSDSIWIEDTFTCEQDTPFQLADTYTGFSSPFGLYWDAPSGMFYGVDCDDASGTFWKFNPNTITGPGSLTYISGSITHDINGLVMDKVNRRIISVGDNSGGAKVLDIATETISNLTYGIDTGGSGGLGLRLPIGLSNDKVYAFCKNPDVVRTYNRSDLSFIQEVNKSAIPSSTTWLSNGYTVWFVGAEVWFIAASRSNGNIARYNNDLTVLLGTITLPGISVAFGDGRYWQQAYYDVDNNRLYVGDSGSHLLFVIDTTTNAIIKTTTITNNKGKAFMDFGMSKSDLDGQIYLQARGLSGLSDPSPAYKLYKIDPSTSDISFIFPGEQGSSLTLRTGTNEQWSIVPGLTIWSVPNTGYATDGLILKYT